MTLRNGEKVRAWGGSQRMGTDPRKEPGGGGQGPGLNDGRSAEDGAVAQGARPAVWVWPKGAWPKGGVTTAPRRPRPSPLTHRRAPFNAPPPPAQAPPPRPSPTRPPPSPLRRSPGRGGPAPPRPGPVRPGPSRTGPTPLRPSRRPRRPRPPPAAARTATAAPSARLRPRPLRATPLGAAATRSRLGNRVRPAAILEAEGKVTPSRSDVITPRRWRHDRYEWSWARICRRVCMYADVRGCMCA